LGFQSAAGLEHKQIEWFFGLSREKGEEVFNQNWNSPVMLSVPFFRLANGNCGLRKIGFCSKLTAGSPKTGELCGTNRRMFGHAPKECEPFFLNIGQNVLKEFEQQHFTEI
jgi:hypothetical protein